MRNVRELPAELAERLELPAAKGRLTLCGGRQALIEDQRGILEYTPERIVVSFGREKLSVSGDGLRLKAMNSGELLVTGRIRAAEWE